MSTFTNFKNVDLHHLSTPIESDDTSSKQKRSCYGWPSWYLIKKGDIIINGSKFIEVEKINQKLKINEIFGSSGEKLEFHMMDGTSINESSMESNLNRLYEVFTKFKNTRLLKKERETCKPEQLNIYNQGFY